MSEPKIAIPLALARRLSDLLGGRWTYDGYRDCRYCGSPLSSEHRCELAQSERELNDLLRCAHPASTGSAPVALQHLACIEDGELRMMTGRAVPPYDCELYAMPGGKQAPALYTQPPAQDAERYRWLREQGDSAQWMNIIRVDPDDFESLDDAIDAVLARNEMKIKNQ